MYAAYGNVHILRIQGAYCVKPLYLNWQLHLRVAQFLSNLLANHDCVTGTVQKSVYVRTAVVMWVCQLNTHYAEAHMIVYVAADMSVACINNICYGMASRLSGYVVWRFVHVGRPRVFFSSDDVMGISLRSTCRSIFLI